MQMYDREKKRHMFEYGTAWMTQSFAYEVKGDSAVILRCFSRDSRAEIPEWIGDYLVTGLGDYAFSEHFEEEKLEKEILEGRVKLYVPNFWGQPMLPPALCGDRLAEIILPQTIRRVGRYCFYNCGKLRRIEFHGELSDWGSGAFTGCHGVRSLRVYTDESGCAHLKDVLDELREELEVEYFSGAADGSRAKEASESIAEDREDDVSGFARLIFPEFYEEGVENTPARILENHVHGSGILYRNCFRGRALDFAQYDALFPHARAWESEELAIRMAFVRLRAPQGLTQKAKEQYETYLSEHAEEAGSWLLARRDLDGLRFLLILVKSQKGGRKRVRDQDSVRKTTERILLEKASRMQYMEAVSFLMEYERANRAEIPSRRRRLEL